MSEMRESFTGQPDFPPWLSDVATPAWCNPDAPALSGIDAPLTYRELDRRVAAARGAFAKLGLAPGQRVALLLPSGPDFVAAYFGAHRAGLVVLPLNPLLGPSEIEFILHSMRPALIVAAAPGSPLPVMGQLAGIAAAASPDTRIAYCGAEVPAGKISFDAQVAAATTDLPSSPRAGSDEVLILFTSGTSGQPKGVSLVQDAVLANARHSNSVLGMAGSDVILCPLPLAHVFGQHVLMLGGLAAGAHLVLVAPPAPDVVLQAMLDNAPTFLAAVPTTYAALAQLCAADPERARNAARRLRYAMAGGAPLPAAIAQTFTAAFGKPLYQGYGMTEVCCCIALESAGEPPSGGVGTLSPLLAHRLVPLDAREPHRGELEIAGPNLFRGYYIDGQLIPRQEDEWFATGDIGEIDAAGRLTLFNRRTELIIRGGYNVYPAEVEAALASHPDVTHAAVVGVDDAEFGQEVAAFVTLCKGATTTAAELGAWCKSRIALYKYPRLMAIVETMPLNATGKILKRNLDPSLLRPMRRGRPPANPEALAANHASARDEIRDAALHLFAEGGVDAIVMRDVAKVLGVSAMMAYRYFPSKDHLLMELRIHAFQQFTRWLHRARLRAKKPEDGLSLVCSAYLRFAMKKPNEYRLMFDPWTFENPAAIKAEFGEAVKRQPRSWLELFAAVSDHVKATGSRADVATATDVLWSTLHGAASLHLARKYVFGRSLKELSRPLIAAIVAGMAR